jgi:5-methylthioadenosine/S-adenosylhomocysteine deaminase
VQTVLVDGRVVVEDRRITTIDEARLADEVAAVMPALRADLGAVRERLAPILPCLCEAQRRTWNTDIGVNRFIAQECP